MFPPRQQDPDKPIRETDNDASLARLSAVKKNYLSDPYVQFFVPRAHLQPPRPPLINIGTYIRSESIDRLVDSWIKLCSSEGKSCQLISLGAGSDTRFWRLANSDNKNSLAKYIEIDFPEITTKKAMAIKKHRELIEALGGEEQVSLANGGINLHSPIYHLLAADIRKPPSISLAPLLTTSTDGFSPLLDPQVPTLLLFECVLAYMQPAESSALIAWFTNCFRQSAPLGVIVYEMFGLEDSFGRVMKNNLKMRNVDLPGAESYTSFESLPRRFTEHGYKLSKARTLKDIRYTCLPADRVQSTMQLEMLDEIEELDLVLAHYAITWGSIWPDALDNDSPKWLAWELAWDADE
ncbi:leucine carboxyl methyltransferase [Fomitiporia mediterranea MF3/22]|uniref:leucine carboxyl methyltransferase n=1 Tax=Fomitiporia mediterranea (strain MF3/22) TaxID=694068 RepID=UPI0004409B6A|nr:leucine carboxyl methyltransferase [Fomitiporia mediterranea MF3/22]EJD07963.1 leucine carboxyl methyltransferase [Fomitiporia mediterranea MF3/22]